MTLHMHNSSKQVSVEVCQQVCGQKLIQKVED